MSVLNLRPFELTLIGIFGAVAIGAVIFVSFYQAQPDESETRFGDTVEIWGTLESAPFDALFTKLSATEQAYSALTYTQKPEETFESELLAAIARGESPDLIILPSTLLVKLRTALTPITEEQFSNRAFRDTYVDGAEIFRLSDGLYGMPFAVDPLIMYWNRELFSAGGLAQPPRTWEELVSVTTPALVRKNASFELTQSAIALGEYGNITNAKAILSLLFLQAGTPIVQETQQGYSVTLSQGAVDAEFPPALAALTFYTSFASPRSEAYSWNRKLQNDRARFLGGALGMYLGFGSEYPSIRDGNPNLNIDVAPVPQSETATIVRNYGTFYAFAIPRASDNQYGAMTAAFDLSRGSVIGEAVQKLMLAPVERSLLTARSTDPVHAIIEQAALITRAWLDPNPTESGFVFRRMVDGVTSGQARISEVIGDAAQRLSLLFK